MTPLSVEIKLNRDDGYSMFYAIRLHRIAIKT